MICQDCKEQNHELCRGGTWCDCAHRSRTVAVVGHPDAGVTTVSRDVGDNDEAQRLLVPAKFEWVESDVPQSLPPEILDSIDKAIADTSTWVRRVRPQRKEEA